MSNEQLKGHRDRLRKRFLESLNFEGFEDYNILELILFYMIPQRDTAQIAKKLLEKFGSLAGVLEADVKDLIKVNYITEKNVILLKLILPIYRAYYESKIYSEDLYINSTSDAIEFFKKKYVGYTNEVFSIVFLNNSSKILSYEVIGEGGLDFVSADVRKIIKLCIENDATNCIIAHNHPGGSIKPSKNDVIITTNIYKAVKAVGINLLDHIIIAGNDGYSLREMPEYKNIFK